MKKICIILNYAPHYRFGIFKLMNQMLDCDFVFGNEVKGNIKKLDYHLLSNYRKEVINKNIFSTHFYTQKGTISLLKENYSVFLLSGELYNLTVWLLLFFGKISGRSIYLWSHGYYGNENFIKRTIKELFFSLSKGVFLYGDYAKNIMLNSGFSNEKIHVIYNSLDYDNQLMIRDNLMNSDLYNLHFENNNPNLVFIGRLTKIKELDLLLLAIKKLRASGLFYNLVLIGEGEEKEKLEELAKSLDIESSIWFYGVCYDEKILADLIYNSDLCVSPGNVGLTAIHSMMYGTAVLTHNNFSKQMPEFESIIDGFTGTYFKYGDSDSLSESIQNWFDSKLSREEVRLNCFKIIDEKYNPTYQIKVFKEHLN